MDGVMKKKKEKKKKEKGNKKEIGTREKGKTSVQKLKWTSRYTDVGQRKRHRKKARFVEHGSTFYHSSPLHCLHPESFVAPLMSPLPIYGKVRALCEVACAQQCRK